jgi:hypothetical protein
MIGMA